MILSILICTIPNRAHMLSHLVKELERQADGYEVEILSDAGKGSIGAKRQRMIESAKGEYVCFIDDDDEVNPRYIPLICANVVGVDVVGFEGQMTTNGRNIRRFSISKDHNYEEKGGVYYRYNNHLSPIRREIALAIGYKDISYGEDYDYATRLKESGLVKTEKYIYTPMYFYKYITRKIYK